MVRFFLFSLLIASLLPTVSCQLNRSDPQGGAASSAAPEPPGRDPVMQDGARFMAKVNAFKKRLEQDPKDREALLFLANANFDISRFAQARDYYKQYLELDPDHSGARTDLATAYYNMQDADSAIRELKTVLKRTQDHPAALYNLGVILAKDRRDPAGAIQAWEALLAANPGDPRAAQIREQIGLLKKKS